MRIVSFCFVWVACLFMACSSRPSSGGSAMDDVAAPTFWDDFDFSDSSMVGNSTVTEAMFLEFCRNLRDMTADERKEEIDSLLHRSETGASGMFQYMMGLAEKYLYVPRSPYRNEECFMSFLDYYVQKGKLKSAYDIRYTYLWKQLRKNRVLTVANDFAYICRDGRASTLHSIKAPYTLVFFYKPDCPDCDRVLDYLAKSDICCNLVGSGQLKVLAIYAGLSFPLWEKNKGKFPTSWISARFTIGGDRKKYNLPVLPSLYLLDKDKVVLVKDGSVEEVEDYLKTI